MRMRNRFIAYSIVGLGAALGCAASMGGQTAPAKAPMVARSVTCTVPKRFGAVRVNVRAGRSSPRE